MPVKCQTVTNLIEKFAPRNLGEDWDNTGLNIGNPSSDISGIMITLDVNLDVVREALSLGANLIVSHHPVIFKSLKNIREDNHHGRLISEIIRNSINIFCAHTNLDSAREGVNQTLAELLQLRNIRVLNPDKPDKIYKVVVFVPESHIDTVRDAVTKAGAGWIGNYSDCTFSVNGIGTFTASENCNPFIGQAGVMEKAGEVRLETVVRENQVEKVIRSMLKAHPYEEVAYDIYPLVNDAGRLGLGRIGEFENSMGFRDFLDLVKEALNISNLRYGGNLEKDVRKIAVCGGSGAGFIKKAAFMGVDVLLTGDVKYHEAQEALAIGLNFVDAGHYATEAPIIKKLDEYLRKNMALEGISVPVFISGINSDLFNYY